MKPERNYLFFMASVENYILLKKLGYLSGSVLLHCEGLSVVH